MGSLRIDTVAGLLGLLEIGVGEVHPWAATIDDIERPDFMIFGLDRGEGVGWEFAVETALALRKVLADEGYDCWPKLTGGGGLHVMVPIERALTLKQVQSTRLILLRGSLRVRRAGTPCWPQRRTGSASSL
jgi:bifunctional non-homologous end joining protein LigD